MVRLGGVGVCLKMGNPVNLVRVLGCYSMMMLRCLWRRCVCFEMPRASAVREALFGYHVGYLVVV
jgi:hypothetical protein